MMILFILYIAYTIKSNKKLDGSDFFYQTFVACVFYENCQFNGINVQFKSINYFNCSLVNIHQFILFQSHVKDILTLLVFFLKVVNAKKICIRK